MLSQKRNGNKILFNTMQKNEIISLYHDQRWQTKNIAKKFGVSKNTIRRRLHEWNAIDSERTSGIRVNHNAFRIITEDSAYWAGILAGDGSVSNNIISLCMKDLEHIEKFKHFMNSLHAIFTRNGSYGISFTSAKACGDLKKWGITENKSLNLEITNQALLYNSNFLRGVVDADGCIYYHPSQETTSIQVFTASELFMNQFRAVVFDMINYNTKVYERNTTDNRGYDMRITDNSAALDMLKILYENDRPALERKKNKALKVIGGKI